MRFSTQFAGLTLWCASTLAQQLSSHCPSSDVCYQLHIPEQTAQSGSGDIYFQLTGATSYSWIGLGQGSRMAGANIFVMYADGQGNVTISPRLGTGHVQPQHDTAAQVTLLEGSGINGDRMVANVRCSNCASWSGGSMDFSSSSATWIWAARDGDALDSTDLSEDISIHSHHGAFNWDFTTAQGGQNANPFVTNTGATGVSSGPSSTSSSTSQSTGPPSASNAIINAHASLASIAFVALFPIGAIILRIPGISNGVRIHAAIQILAYIMFVAAAGLGIYAADYQEQLTQAHPIIGMLLLGILFFQPFFGLIHHQLYKKHQRRTSTSHLHIWEGRLAVLLGMINGGLGLQLATGTKADIIAYSVFAGIMGVLFIAASVFGEIQGRKRRHESTTSTARLNGQDKEHNGSAHMG